MNTGDPWPDLIEAEHRVLVMQTKLHQWAISDPDRCFDDLYNLVYDPAFLPDPAEGAPAGGAVLETPVRTMAELSDEEKDAISHRGRAVRALLRWLAERGD